MYYIIEVIKAVWPVAIIMGLIAIPILTWIMHPREKKTKDLLDHPTSSMNEPYPDKKSNRYCYTCNKTIDHYFKCEDLRCPTEPKENETIR